MPEVRRLSVKDLVHLAWCPAKLWLARHGPRLGWPVRHYGPEERAEHDRLAEGLARLAGPGCRVKREPLIESPSLGLQGRPDALVICPDRCIALEAKTRPPGRTGLDWLQAAAYASILAAGPCAGREAYALIVWPGGEMRVDPDPALIAGLARRARRILRLPSPPPPEKPYAACRACEYRRICPHSTA